MDGAPEASGARLEVAAHHEEPRRGAAQVRGPKRGLGLRRETHRGVEPGQVHQGRGIARLDLERRAVGRERPAGIAELPSHDAQVGVRRGEAGIDARRVLEPTARLVRAAGEELLRPAVVQEHRGQLEVIEQVEPDPRIVAPAIEVEHRGPTAVLVDGDDVAVDHHEVTLLLRFTDVRQQGRPRRQPDRAREREEQVRERHAVAGSPLEGLAGGQRDARVLVIGERRLVE